MTDVHDKKTRSYNMSMIKGKNTKPELIVRKYLHAKGYRFRINYKNLPGKPDIVLPKYKTVIFIHGCFWHGHEGCRYYVVPQTRTEWWVNKIQRNKEIDKENLIKLTDKGWIILTVFECELKPKVKEKTLNNILKFIKFDNTSN